MPTAPRTAVVRLYRTLLREARRTTPSKLQLVDALDLRDWGTGGFIDVTHHAEQLQQALFPHVSFAPVGSSTTLSPDDLVRLVKYNFRRPASEEQPHKALSPAKLGCDAAVDPLEKFIEQLSGHADARPPAAPLPPPKPGLDAALRHLSTLCTLRSAAASSCTTRTRTSYGDRAAVEVEVSTAFVPTLPTEAAVRMQAFPFAYRIRIANVGSAHVQLVGRHWVFTDSEGGTLEVPRGSPGVVGRAPFLRPGQAFQYMSGTELATPSGTMRGSFQMLELPPPRKASRPSTPLSSSSSSSSAAASSPTDGGEDTSGASESDSEPPAPRPFDAFVKETRLHGPVEEVAKLMRESGSASSTSTEGDGGSSSGGLA